MDDVHTEQPDAEYHLSDPPPPLSQLSARALTLPVRTRLAAKAIIIHHVNVHALICIVCHQVSCWRALTSQPH